MYLVVANARYRLPSRQPAARRGGATGLDANRAAAVSGRAGRARAPFSARPVGNGLAPAVIWSLAK